MSSSYETSSGPNLSEKPDLTTPNNAVPGDSSQTGSVDVEDVGEVFQQAQYRALGWKRTVIILMKLCFATGVLTIPSAFSAVGYGPGIILLVSWGTLTTYYAYVMYAFRMRYPGVHNIADAAALMGGPVAREYSNAWKIVDSGMDWVCIDIHGRIHCSVDRPAAAPQEGPYDMEVHSIGAPAFVPGVVATINLFVGYGSTPTFMPVIAEMRSPRSFTKSLFSSQIFLGACYVSFGTVVYVYCGKYVASPSLGSAGGTLEKIAYGISIPGFIMTTTLWVHLAAKFLLVRILRNSVHLQNKSFVHWATWLGSTLGISALAFVIAEAVPFFSYLVGLIGSICCMPTCLIIPAFMGLYMDWEVRSLSKAKMGLCLLHCFTVVLASFMTVAGTYTTIQSIVDAYRSGEVGSAFTC
uniref:Neutral amino acid transporter n=1 Tax=Colletotrichum fructicola (strain Nara gc5) TaxID=1213859 RepID=L2GHZ4_COLFN